MYRKHEEIAKLEQTKLGAVMAALVKMAATFCTRI